MDLFATKQKVNFYRDVLRVDIIKTFVLQFLYNVICKGKNVLKKLTAAKKNIKNSKKIPFFKVLYVSCR